MRSTALFALFGFVAALVNALGREQPLEETLQSGFGWAIGFGILGCGIGRVARAIAAESGTKTEDSGSVILDTTDKRKEEAWIRPDWRQRETPLPSEAVLASEREQDSVN